MLKILGKTGDIQKNQQNYLGTKKYFAVADRGTFIGHERLTYFISPLRPILEQKKLFYDIYGIYIFSDHHFFRI